MKKIDVFDASFVALQRSEGDYQMTWTWPFLRSIQTNGIMKKGSKSTLRIGIREKRCDTFSFAFELLNDHFWGRFAVFLERSVQRIQSFSILSSTNPD